MVCPSTKINAVDVLQRSLSRVCFNIISLFATRLHQWPSSFRFPHPSPIYISLLSHVPRVQLLITLITFGQQYQTWRSSLHSFLELRVTSSILSSTFPQHPVMSQYSPNTLLCPNIPPTPCYVPIFPQHPVRSQYSPNTLLCPNIPPTPCYVPIFPQHLAMSQYSPQQPDMSQLSPHLATPNNSQSMFSFPLLSKRNCNSKCKQLTPMEKSLILPSLLLEKKFNL